MVSLGVKDPVFSPLQCGFDPWPKNFCMSWAWPKRKGKKKKLVQCIYLLETNSHTEVQLQGHLGNIVFLPFWPLYATERLDWV